VRPFGIVYAPSSGENPQPARAKLLPIAAVIAIDPSLSGLGSHRMCPGGRSGGIPSRPLRPSADGRWSSAPCQQPCCCSNSESRIRTGRASYIHNYSSSCAKLGCPKEAFSRTNGTVRPSEGGRERRAQREEVGNGSRICTGVPPLTIAGKKGGPFLTSPAPESNCECRAGRDR
jgi:hypothetical protein